MVESFLKLLWIICNINYCQFADSPVQMNFAKNGRNQERSSDFYRTAIYFVKTVSADLQNVLFFLVNIFDSC